ncbi:MAG: DUF499 domain-containing protein [Gemmatimonadota bacterium]|nr:DUF499 domain-containing protein [Gemmatimonadota bacterium]
MSLDPIPSHTPPIAPHMPTPTIFDLCRPRDDILKGSVAEAEFAADLAQVLTGTAPADYTDPARFFANTHPTRGLKDLLANVCRRLSGVGGEAAAIFRLDTSYGGGKTHGLIALIHAARGMKGVADPDEFVDPSLLPDGSVRVAAFDGENADPASGRSLEHGLRAHTPWGELAYALAGRDGYERVRESDERHVAPGAGTLRELFGDQPTLILLDELSIYLRKAQGLGVARGQLTSFLSSLFKAVEGTADACAVYTLAIGKAEDAVDAYSEENRQIAESMAELEKASARKATLLNPTQEDETVHVLRRRLFESVDDGRVPEVVGAYRRRWAGNRDSLPPQATRSETAEAFRAGYPFHPEVLDTLTGKTATLDNFQRVRGMLRLLGKTVARLWEQRPGDACAIHLHHIDPGHEPIRQEVVTRLGQSSYQPAISNDVSSGSAERRSFAQLIDSEFHGGLPPYAEYAARTVLLHTLAYNDPLKGLPPEQLRYSMVGPELDIAFIEDARKKFVAESAYLDDRPGAPMRFLIEANLSQIIRREERNVDAAEARAELKDRIRQVFGGNVFDTVHFPGGPFDVPDEIGGGRPKLAVLSYDGVTIGAGGEGAPELVTRIYERKGSQGAAIRRLRNHVVFVVADDVQRNKMRDAMRRVLALRILGRADRIVDLAEYQQNKVRELAASSEHSLTIAIQTCYRHIFYPSRQGVGPDQVSLGHTAIDAPSASDRPGAGQRQVVRVLRELNKLRLSEDEPDSPTYVRDRTPLKSKGEMTTLALRTEFRRNPALPILIGDDVFIRGVREGVKGGHYVYRSGQLVYGPGDPSADIRIDERSMVLTIVYAKNKGVWPRPEPEPVEPDPPVDSPVDPPPPDLPPPTTMTTFEAEGLLGEALTEIWEKARGEQGVGRIAELRIRPFNVDDGFRLLGPVGSVSAADKEVRIEGEYETTAGGSLELRFMGPVPDAQPLKEFLAPQLRAASDSHVDVSMTLRFKQGLTLKGGEPEKLTERLSRFAGGSAHVTATAAEED